MSYSLTVTPKQAEQAELEGATVINRTIYFTQVEEIATLLTNLNHATPNKERGTLRAHNALIQKVLEMKTHPSEYRYFGDFNRLIAKELPNKPQAHETEIACTSGQTRLLKDLDMGELCRLSNSVAKKATLIYSTADEDSVTAFFQSEYERRCIGGEKRIVSTILAKMGKSILPPTTNNVPRSPELSTVQYAIVKCVAKLVEVQFDKDRPHFNNRMDATKLVDAFRDLVQVGMAKQSNLKILAQLEIIREEIPVDTAVFKAIIDDMKKPELLPDPIVIEPAYEPEEEGELVLDDYKDLLTSARDAYYSQGPDPQGPSQADLAAIEDEEGLYIDDLIEPAPSVLPEDEEIELIPNSISLEEYQAEEEPYCDTCGEELDYCDCSDEKTDDDCCVMVRIINTLSYFGRDRVNSWGAVFSDNDEYEVFYTQSADALAFADFIDEAMDEIPEDDETAHERIGDELEGIRRQAY